MQNADAKPAAEVFKAPLAAFSFFFRTCLGGALAGAFRARVEGNQFSRPSPPTFLPTKKLCLIFGICWVASSGCFGKDAYRFLSEIPIGGEGGWDILTIDSAASRLYVSHATKVVVVDLNTNSVTGEIADTPGVHAFLAVPEVQRGFSSNGKESKSSVVDLITLKTTSKFNTGSNPDAVVYEPRHGEVYVFKDMGVNTWVAFAGSDNNAVVDGDFAVTEDQLQPVLSSLLKDKINIVAIHQHMAHEEPRILFFHYWGKGTAKDLAQAIKGGMLVAGLLQVSSPR